MKLLLPSFAILVILSVVSDVSLAAVVPNLFNCKDLNVGGVHATCEKDKTKPWKCTLECRAGFVENLGDYEKNNITSELKECASEKRQKEVTCICGGKWCGEPLKCDERYNCKYTNSKWTKYKCSERKLNKPFQCSTECIDGYILQEKNVPITCKEDSKWERPLPTCKYICSLGNKCKTEDCKKCCNYTQKNSHKRKNCEKTERLDNGTRCICAKFDKN